MASPYSASQPTKGSVSRASKPPATAIRVKKYTPMQSTISLKVSSTSRTARAVCMTLVVTRPANSLEKKDRLWRSISRWKSQRSRSGRLMASTWCCMVVRSATRPMLATITTAMPHSTRCACSAGPAPVRQASSRSTTWPRKANSQAS